MQPHHSQAPAIVPNLWFPGTAQEAAHFYADLFGGAVLLVQRYGPDMPGPEGEVMYVEWEMLGGRYGGINGGDQFPFTEAISLEVRCDSQGEIDRVWAGLIDGGQPGPCGWLTDRYGVSWQVTPTVLAHMLSDADPARANRAAQYFLALDGERFDLAALQSAYDG